MTELIKKYKILEKVFLGFPSKAVELVHKNPEVSSTTKSKLLHFNLLYYFEKLTKEYTLVQKKKLDA